MHLELGILAPNPGLGHVARRPTSDLRWLAHEGPLACPAALGRPERKALWLWWGASGDSGESLLKQQLIVLRRARKRAPNLTSSDRLLCGFWSIFLTAGRIRKAALALHPSTLLAFHQALVRRKYRRLCSSTPDPRRPGPKGPSDALIQAIVELKSRNPRFGCPRIALIISQTFGVAIDKNVVSRVLSKHYRPAPGGTGPSSLSFIGHTRDSLWSVDLFRCESIVLRSYWVLVVMDQFTRPCRTHSWSE